MTGLLNLIAQASGAQLELPVAAVENVIKTEVRDLGEDTRVVLDGEGRLVAVALVRLPPEGGFRVSLTGGVHPDAQGRGIGRDLLAWQLDRAGARHAELAPDAAWEAEVDAGADNASAVRLYTRSGFRVERFFLEMSAATGAPPAVPPVEGVEIVPLGQDRAPEVHAVHMAAFHGLWGHQDRSYEDWAALTFRSETFLPELARLAVVRGEVVGYVLPYADGPQALYIGQVGTSGAWRGRGVASALLADLLGAAGRSGYVKAALETDAGSAHGASGVYERVGFAVDQRIVVYRHAL
ncbi:GNAT family N-acetyltransferase [Actinocorallia lasiicapitis]